MKTIAIVPDHRAALSPRVLAAVLAIIAAGCRPQTPAWDPEAGVLMKPAENAAVSEAIKAAAATVPPRIMRGSGLVGAMGGVNLKAQRAGTYDLLLPMPQIVNSQVPVFYTLDTKPKTALTACRLQVRDDGNAFISLKMGASADQEISVEWYSVVLIAPKALSQDRSTPEPFRAASPCAEADAAPIVALAGKLYPAGGAVQPYATNIQEFVRKMERQKQPTSLDAKGILESGQNTICTANANLACALMRAKQIPCRSIATIPVISSRLEMHRIVEYHDQGAWTPFDPSRVFADVPLKPWQNVIMLKTSVADEQASMKFRPGSMLGCPLGQEIEFARPGLNFFGQSFYWTQAVPLAEFEVTDEAATLTANLWEQFLKSGTLNLAQSKAALSHDPAHYLEALKAQ